MERILHWLWLVTRKGIGPLGEQALLDAFGTVDDIYFAKSYNNIHRLSVKRQESLMDKDLTGAEKVLEEIYRLGARVITYDSKNYPALLKNISSPPHVLYIQGKVLELDDVLTIGVVGTREASKFGRAVTERFCRDLAKAGAVTISGLARGVDTVAAWATLDAGGTTVAVTGCGLDTVYPPENSELIKAISQNGCIITEYPPGTEPFHGNFPRRNRIIAGLSRGVLVTEAPARSGALITANFALEHNRDVFAIPRRIDENAYNGTNRIIQQGAKLVMNAEDILCEYPYAQKIEPFQKPTEEKTQEDKRLLSLDDKEKEIVNILRKNDAQIDELSRKLKIPVGELNTILVMLEMKGIIKKLPGSGYQLKL